MSTIQPKEPTVELTDVPQDQVEPRLLTVAERLAMAGEYFIEGSSDSSDRDIRKAALHTHWDERHSQRQGE
jgi:hypothetical protein